MSLIIPNDWFVNEDKSITFYDTTRHKDCCTNKTKNVVPSWAAANPTAKEVKLVQMYEHQLTGKPSNFQISPSTQFDGFQVYYKSKFSIILALSLGRRVRENKEYTQTQEQIEVLFGLREPEPVEEEPVVETPVVELEAIVVQ